MSDFKNVSDMLPNSNTRQRINLEEQFVKRYNKTILETKFGQCEKCGNKGLIAFLEEGRAVFKKCSCYRIRKAREKLERVGLFEILKQYPNMDSFSNDEEWEKVVNTQLRDYLTNNELKYWLYLGGQNGSGKTTKGTLAFYNIIKQNTDLSIDYFLWDSSWQSLIPSKDHRQVNEIMQDLQDVDVLYIDDFLRHRDGNKMSNYERDVAKDLINYRYMHNKLTIISSELLYSELKDLDEAIASRIFERCKKSKFVLSIGRDNKRNYREREED